MEPAASSRFLLTAEGWHFQIPLGVLRRAAEATHRMFEAEIWRLEDSFRQLDAEPASPSDDPSVETDGPDPHDLPIDAQQAAEDAANEARKAFAIAGYHHWEHAIGRRLREDHAAGRLAKVPEPSGKELDKTASSFGWTIGPEIARLRALVNLLKHDSEKKFEALKAVWPDFLRPEPRWQNDTDSGFAQAVRLDQTQLLEIFDIVERSGPPSLRPASAEEIAWFDAMLGSPGESSPIG